MNISSLSIKRPVCVIMALIAVLIIGSVSLTRLEMDLLPSLTMPVAVVTARYEGAGPSEMETLVTRPFEAILSSVSDMKSLKTVSTNEYSLIILNFGENTDMDYATLEIREKVDMVKTMLPDGVTDIMVMKINPNDFESTMEIGISAKSDLSDLTRKVEDQVINKLKRISGVASVTLRGGAGEEIRIALSSDRLLAYGLDKSTVSQYLALENLNMPAGNLETSGLSMYLRTDGEFGDLEDIKNLILPTPAGGIIRLRDIGEVTLAESQLNSISYVNGSQALNLSIQKQSEANLVAVCRQINASLEELRTLYPDLSFHTVYDGSVYIEQAISAVVDAVIQGSVLSVLILFLFLRNWRATLIIGLSIPVSIVGTFVMMFLWGINLNLMSLGGLALGVGMVVDNSIVVLENIYRYRHEGLGLKPAAEKGSRDVLLAITASTLTAIVVFVPILFIEGFTGQVFKEMALIMTFSMIASLLVAITFVPMISSRILDLEGKSAGKPSKGPFSKLLDGWEHLYEKLASGYSRLLNVCIRRKGVTIATAIILFALSLLSALNVGFEYFPSMDEGVITVSITLPKGSTLSETHSMAFKVETLARQIPELQETYITIGNSGSVLDRSTTEKATLTLNVGDVTERKRNITQIADELRKKVANLAGADIKILDDSRVMGISMGESAVDIRVSGDDTEELKRLSGDLKYLVERIPGLTEVESSIEEETTEAVIRVDRNKAVLYGLTGAQIGDSVRSAINGSLATRYKYRGSEIDVMAYSLEEGIQSLEEINNIPVQSPRGVLIPLSELADIALQKSPANIIREDQKRTVSITANLGDRALNRVTEDLEEAFKDYAFPEGYTYTFEGQQQDLFEAFDALIKALALSVLLVYMLLAAQLESFIHPFTIMLSVPLALTGGLISLAASGMRLSIPAFIGMIMLVGIVVNNAIVLIDCINRLRQEGMTKEAAVAKAGPLRLRAILMTTLTTLLGILPMVIGGQQGSEIMVPLSVAVTGGLTLSTFVTLLVLPAFYLVFDDIIHGVGNRNAKKNKNLPVQA